MPIKNLNKVAKRLLKALKNKEKIILYGDADPDGIASVIILKETIKNLGGEVSVIYFPDRETEGYGLNKKALKFLEKEAPALLFLLDCGIGNFEEIKRAAKKGFEVIVIDHHEILGEIPKASIVVDPKQKGDPYAFKALATSGIVYKLSEVLLSSIRDYRGKEKKQREQISNGASPIRDYKVLTKRQKEQISGGVKDKFSQGLKDNFLELVALSTLADMMPKEEDNKIFIEQGLQSLEKTFRPGLRAFFEIGAIERDFDLYQIASKIIACLNAGKVKNHLNEAYLLLTASDIKKAKALAEKLVKRSFERKQKIEEITDEVEQRLFAKITESIIFIGDYSWPITLLGSVASKICRVYQKPTFIFSQGKKQSVGAVRMPKDLNGVKAMESCSQYLKTYGGHPLAAGFTVLNKNLKKLEKCLTEYFNQI